MILNLLGVENTFIKDRDTDGAIRVKVALQRGYHLQNVSGNFGWKVNGRRLFGSLEWEISGNNGMPEKVVLFSGTECSNGNSCSISSNLIFDTSSRLSL